MAKWQHRETGTDQNIGYSVGMFKHSIPGTVFRFPVVLSLFHPSCYLAITPFASF